ncbi:hypothetical protein CwatDRAFT_3781 [Crocosphaera watsonii WH 8501]|uniref:Uncharacterized protein n=2 Tax=Crocosphaera watsonii TaxID=263511 RepID=Q4C3Q6_CROWT|nr:hypothetical protein CwatDRAFT_3781 [Crocosphaera watsonii WH 8501]
MRNFFLYCCLVIVMTVWGCQSPPDSNNSQPTTESPTISQETMNDNTEIPQAVIDAVFNDITKNNAISADKLEVKETQPNTWPDGCLGLAGPDEFCTQALVEGWRVTATDGQTTWAYRTDQTGANLRIES